MNARYSWMSLSKNKKEWYPVTKPVISRVIQADERRRAAARSHHWGGGGEGIEPWGGGQQASRHQHGQFRQGGRYRAGGLWQGGRIHCFAYLLTWVTWLKVSGIPGRVVVDTYGWWCGSHNVLEGCWLQNTCIPPVLVGFVYTRFALWFSVRLSGKLPFKISRCHIGAKHKHLRYLDKCSSNKKVDYSLCSV